MTKNVIFAGVLLGISIVGVFFFLDSLRVSASYSDSDPAFNKPFWESTIQTYGGGRAYADFLKRNAAAPEKRRHFASHVMGGALFNMLGMDGLRVCDSAFGFGCFHGFFSAAVSGGGKSDIRALDRACVDSFGVLGTGCQHGIGHGLLEYLGYPNIRDALALCTKETTQIVPLLGCTSGVFMEYLIPLQGTGDALSPMPKIISPDDPYDPCLQVPQEFMQSCFYELGRAFHQFGADNRLSRYCAALDADERTYCFLGVGTDIANTAGSVEEAILECATFGSGGTLPCRAGAAWGFWANRNHDKNAAALCAYASTDERETCNTLADLTQKRDPSFPYAQ